MSHELHTNVQFSLFIHWICLCNTKNYKGRVQQFWVSCTDLNKLPLTWTMFILTDLVTVLFCKFYIFQNFEKEHWEKILRKKCPYSGFFWSIFSRIRTEYGEIRSSARMRENTDQKTPHTDTFYAVKWVKLKIK